MSPITIVIRSAAKAKRDIPVSTAIYNYTTYLSGTPEEIGRFLCAWIMEKALFCVIIQSFYEKMSQILAYVKNYY